MSINELTHKYAFLRHIEAVENAWAKDNEISYDDLVDKHGWVWSGEEGNDCPVSPHTLERQQVGEILLTALFEAHEAHIKENQHG